MMKMDIDEPVLLKRIWVAIPWDTLPSLAVRLSPSMAPDALVMATLILCRDTFQESEDS